jgi:hypothetical protein
MFTTLCNKALLFLVKYCRFPACYPPMERVALRRAQACQLIASISEMYSPYNEQVSIGAIALSNSLT